MRMRDDVAPGSATPSRSPLTNLLRWTVVAAVMFVGVVVFHRVTEVSIGLMARDPNQVAQGRAWTGIVSTLGNALWVVSASVAFFATLVITLPLFRRTGAFPRSSPQSSCSHLGADRSGRSAPVVGTERSLCCRGRREVHRDRPLDRCRPADEPQAHCGPSSAEG